MSLALSPATILTHVVKVIKQLFIVAFSPPKEKSSIRPSISPEWLEWCTDLTHTSLIQDMWMIVCRTEPYQYPELLADGIRILDTKLHANKTRTRALNKFLRHSIPNFISVREFIQSSNHFDYFDEITSDDINTFPRFGTIIEGEISRLKWLVGNVIEPLPQDLTYDSNFWHDVGLAMLNYVKLYDKTSIELKDINFFDSDPTEPVLNSGITIDELPFERPSAVGEKEVDQIRFEPQKKELTEFPLRVNIQQPEIFQPPKDISAKVIKTLTWMRGSGIQREINEDFDPLINIFARSRIRNETLARLREQMLFNFNENLDVSRITLQTIFLTEQTWLDGDSNKIMINPQSVAAMNPSIPDFPNWYRNVLNHIDRTGTLWKDAISFNDSDGYFLIHRYLLNPNINGAWVSNIISDMVQFMGKEFLINHRTENNLSMFDIIFHSAPIPSVIAAYWDQLSSIHFNQIDSLGNNLLHYVMHCNTEPVSFALTIIDYLEKTEKFLERVFEFKSMLSSENRLGITPYHLAKKNSKNHELRTLCNSVKYRPDDETWGGENITSVNWHDPVMYLSEDSVWDAFSYLTKEDIKQRVIGMHPIEILAMQQGVREDIKMEIFEFLMQRAGSRKLYSDLVERWRTNFLERNVIHYLFENTDHYRVVNKIFTEILKEHDTAQRSPRAIHGSSWRDRLGNTPLSLALSRRSLCVNMLIIWSWIFPSSWFWMNDKREPFHLIQLFSHPNFVKCAINLTTVFSDQVLSIPTNSKMFQSSTGRTPIQLLFEYTAIQPVVIWNMIKHFKDWHTTTGVDHQNLTTLIEFQPPTSLSYILRRLFGGVEKNNFTTMFRKFMNKSEQFEQRSLLILKGIEENCLKWTNKFLCILDLTNFEQDAWTFLGFNDILTEKYQEIPTLQLEYETNSSISSLAKYKWSLEDQFLPNNRWATLQTQKIKSPIDVGEILAKKCYEPGNGKVDIGSDSSNTPFYVHRQYLRLVMPEYGFQIALNNFQLAERLVLDLRLNITALELSKREVEVLMMIIYTGETVILDEEGYAITDYNLERTYRRLNDQYLKLAIIFNAWFKSDLFPKVDVSIINAALELFTERHTRRNVLRQADIHVPRCMIFSPKDSQASWNIISDEDGDIIQLPDELISNTPIECELDKKKSKIVFDGDSLREIGIDLLSNDTEIEVLDRMNK